MIYTVTFSPAIDYVVDIKHLEIGAINRSIGEHAMAGGKGINVSIVLANFGTENIATGFLGGFTGRFIKDELNNMGVKSDFVEVEGLTRINVKLRGEEGETAINGQGPHISEEQIEELIKKLEKLGEEDLLVISGTIPKTLPDNIYETILERIKDNKVRVVIDSTKEILLNTLKYKPLLVKPNQEELEEMFNVKINNRDELVATAKRLLDLGAQNVIVSLGGDGALLVNNEHVIKSGCPKGKVVNTVGAGDSLVAGVIDEYMKSGNIVMAFYKGIATGSASACSEGLATKEDVEKLLNKLDEWKGE